MQLNDNQKKAIINEYNQWKDKMYANKTLSERQDFGQFFTPAELTIKMLEKFEDLDGVIIDPTCGAGNLLAAAIAAGARPENIYGNELDEEILNVCKERLMALGVPESNFVLSDILTEKFWDFLKSKGIIKSKEFRSGNFKFGGLK